MNKSLGRGFTCRRRIYSVQQLTMLAKICVLLGFYATCIFAQGGHVTEKYPHSSVLNSQNYTLYWKANSTTIVFEIHANSQGWAGLGFTKDGTMFPGDAVMGWVDANGKGHLVDYHTTGHRLPTKDSSQDYTLLDSQLNHSGLMLKFARALDTNDHNDWTLTSGDTFVIWAYGDLDPATGNPTYHSSNRGAKALPLLATGGPVGK